MRYFLTLVTPRCTGALTPSVVEAVQAVVGGGTPVWLAADEAVDIPCAAPPDLGQVRATLGEAEVDALASPAAGRRRRLLVADMDGTIVNGETLDMLAEEAGLGSQVAAITARSMAGELDFSEALLARAAMLRGLETAACDRVLARVKLHEGARTLVATMKGWGARCVLVTGGFSILADQVAAWCGFDAVHANDLVVEAGFFTGDVVEPVLDAEAKRAALLTEAAALRMEPESAMALGDGANDIPMLRAAGLAIGMRPKQVVEAAVANRVHYAGLRAALFVQGFAPIASE